MKNHPHVLFTTCCKCNFTLCCECLEHISAKVDKFKDRVVRAPVWDALQRRVWRSDLCEKEDLVFCKRAAGGGCWKTECPLCVEQFFPEPSVLIPATLKGEPYLTMQPRYERSNFVVSCALPRSDGTYTAVGQHEVELYIFEQLDVDDDEARRCFQRAPATGEFMLFYEPPTAGPAQRVNSLRVRVVAGRPHRGGELVLLSAVAFGALRGCLEQGRSPTLDTTAMLARMVSQAHVKRRVVDGPAKNNYLHSNNNNSPANGSEATYRCMRAGGAFGMLHHVSDRLSVIRKRYISTRCDARLPRGPGTVCVPVSGGAGCISVWMSPERVQAAHLPAAAQPPVSGADATGAGLSNMMQLDGLHSADAINMLARATTNGCQ